MYRYAKIINGELWIRQKHKGAPWVYVCHELEIGKTPINNKTVKQGRFQYKGFLFDWDEWLGPCKLRKDGSVAAREGLIFYKAIDRWLELPDDKREKTRHCG